MHGHLFTHVDSHKSKSSSAVHKHYDKDHAGAIYIIYCYFLHVYVSQKLIVIN